MARIAVVSFVPVLRDFDPWQWHGGTESRKTQAVGKEVCDIGWHRRNAIGSRSNDCGSNKTWQAKQDAFGGEFGLKSMLYHLMCRMPRV
jgi:hypothetical protein